MKRDLASCSIQIGILENKLDYIQASISALSSSVKSSVIKSAGSLQERACRPGPGLSAAFPSV